MQKDKILRSAFRLFREKGYNDTTTREIAECARITRGLLHYYYKQKEDILSELDGDLLNGTLQFITESCEMKGGGLVYIAIFDLFYYKVLSAHPYLNRILSDVLSNRSLTKIKIEKTIDFYLKICRDFDIPMSRNDLFLPTAVAIGAEVELLLNIIEETLDMSFDELAETIIKLEFMMLHVHDQQIEDLIAAAKKECEKFDVSRFNQLFQRNYSWSVL